MQGVQRSRILSQTEVTSMLQDEFVLPQIAERIAREISGGLLPIEPTKQKIISIVLEELGKARQQTLKEKGKVA
jgi:hypothetical protein